MLSTAVLLFFVIDPIGSLPIYATVLGRVPAARRRRVLVRELLFALAGMVLVLLAGRFVLRALHVSEPALSIAGAIILFLVALPMIFPTVRLSMETEASSEPFIVPLAVPLFLGPSTIAMLVLLGGGDAGTGRVATYGAVGIAWVAAAAVLVAGDAIASRLGKRGMIALERLMGMLLVAVSVEMLLGGLDAWLDARVG